MPKIVIVRDPKGEWSEAWFGLIQRSLEEMPGVVITEINPDVLLRIIPAEDGIDVLVFLSIDMLGQAQKFKETYRSLLNVVLFTSTVPSKPHQGINFVNKLDTGPQEIRKIILGVE